MHKFAIVISALVVALAFTTPATAGKAVVKSTSSTSGGTAGVTSTPGLPKCDAGSKDPALMANKGGSTGGTTSGTPVGGNSGAAATTGVKNDAAHGCPTGRRIWKPI